MAKLVGSARDVLSFTMQSTAGRSLPTALQGQFGSGEFVDKPVTLFNAQPRGTYPQASLTETLTVMAAKVVPEASVTLQLLGKASHRQPIVADRGIAAEVRSALAAFAGAVETLKATGWILRGQWK